MTLREAEAFLILWGRADRRSLDHGYRVVPSSMWPRWSEAWDLVSAAGGNPQRLLGWGANDWPICHDGFDLWDSRTDADVTCTRIDGHGPPSCDWHPFPVISDPAADEVSLPAAVLDLPTGPYWQELYSAGIGTAGPW